MYFRSAWVSPLPGRLCEPFRLSCVGSGMTLATRVSTSGESSREPVLSRWVMGAGPSSCSDFAVVSGRSGPRWRRCFLPLAGLCTCSRCCGFAAVLVSVGDAVFSLIFCSWPLMVWQKRFFVFFVGLIRGGFGCKETSVSLWPFVWLLLMDTLFV